MKTIKKVDDKLLPIELGDILPQQEYDRQATFRRLFRLALATAKGSPERSLDQYDLNQKFARVLTPDVELEDAEYKLLQDVVKQNPTDLIPFFLAQLLKKLP